jgi:glyoxylase-like metal-dependent hydrolase (beta-lactamase superfamily II)
LWSKAHPPDERNRIRLAMRCLLLEGPGRRVLVDDGAGDKLAPKLADIYRIEYQEHTLERSLESIGLGVEDVTDVLLTHLHFDHAGGSTRRDGGVLKPRLPRARYYVQRRNWENALHPNARERASYMPENFLPLEGAGAVTLWDGPQSPWPGVELFTADGHTRGQQLVRVSGPEGVLYFVADLIPTRSHVRLPFIMGYDACAIQTMEEKRALLSRASAEGAWICLEHDPEVALARPGSQADDFGWVETMAASTAAPLVPENVGAKRRPGAIDEPAPSPARESAPPDPARSQAAAPEVSRSEPARRKPRKR